MTFTCGVCGRKLASLFSLMEHKRIHTGERPYVCTVCQKRFTQKAHLVIHKRTHTGEKPYACHICHKRFAQSSHLNNHKRIHTGEKPYFCNVCNLGFSRKQRLELHVLQHAQPQQQNNNSSNSNNSGGVVCGSNNNAPLNVDDVNSTITSNANTIFSSEAESPYSRTLLDSNQSQISSSSRTDPTLQNLNFSHRRKPAFVTRVSNDEYGDGQGFDPQAIPSQDDGTNYGLSNITSGHHASLMKCEPKDYKEFDLITHELDSINHPVIGNVISSDASVGHQLVTTQMDHDFREQPKIIEDALAIHMEGSGHQELMRDVHSSSDPDIAGICAVSTTDGHHVTSGDDGDGASVTSESNNSNSEQSISSQRMPKHPMLGHPVVKMSKSPLPQMHGHGNRQRVVMSHKMTVSTSSSATSSTCTLPRHSSRMCLVDFSTEELLAHLMARDDVYRCDFCCLLFQDAAMYHLHRSMHDKIDCRCCNICGKLSKDKHDFIAHFLSEHK